MSSHNASSGSILAIGSLARVAEVDTDQGLLYARYPSGAVLHLEAEGATELETDDVVLVQDDGRWESVPRALWPEPTGVGVLRKELDRSWIVESGSGLVLTSQRGVDAEVGNTVRYSIADGVLQIIDELPIRARLRDDDDGDDVSRFELSVDGDGLSYSDFGGYESVVKRARHIIETQFQHEDELRSIKARPVRGVLFSGAPGTGKTYLAKVIAAQSGAAFFQVSGPSIVSKYVGDSEDLLRRLFIEAQERDRAIIFFDEIDSIVGERSSSSHEASDRLVAQFLTELDGVSGDQGNVIVLAATNRPESIDPALRRPGRFDWEIKFELPTADDRLAILEVDAKRLASSADLPLEEIADVTSGWSGAELAAIWTEAALLAASDGRRAIDWEDLFEGFEIVAEARKRRSDES